MKLKKDDDLYMFGVSIMLLLACIFLYVNCGAWAKFGFPTTQMLCALPIAFAIWGVCAFVDPKIYASWLVLLSCTICGTAVFTGTFFIFAHQK